MNKIKNILYLTKLEWVRALRQSKNLFFLLILFLIVGNLFLTLKSSSQLPLKTLALVVEDNSLEVKTFMSNITDNRLKGILAFESMDLPSAMEAMEEGRVLGVFHVKKGLFDNLDEGKKESLELYIANPQDPVSEFLVKYVDNLTQVLNEAQNSAMIYLRQMRSSNLSSKEITKEFASIQVDYVSAFLTRSSVFTEGDPLDNYLGLGLLSYYYFSAMVILAFFSAAALTIPLKEDLLRGRINRMKTCGHSTLSIYLPKIMAFTSMLGLSLFAMKALYHLLMKEPIGGSEVFPLLMICLLAGFILLLTVLVLMRYTAENPGFDWIFGGVLFIIFILSGLIFPLPALGRSWRFLESTNPILFIHRLLMGSSLSPITFGILLLYAGILLLLLYLKERR